MTIELRVAPIVGELSRVKDVVSRPFAPADTASEKGKNTWNLMFPPVIKGGRTMVARRFKGMEVGNHFHPRTLNKDPEVFLLILGRISFWFRDLFDGSLNLDIDAGLGPTEILIPPYLLHGIVVKSYEAWFLEQQGEQYDPLHNYSADEFELLKKSLE